MFTLLLSAIVAAAPAQTSAANCAPATGFTGTVCTPGTPGRHPAILLLGGSEGGDSMKAAAPNFAQAGYVAITVPYFKMPGMPQQLVEIPVETVGRALQATSKRDDVDPKKIALFGISKGGELALLAASTYPQIKAVIADVPSPFAWEGIPQGPEAVGSSWTLGGKPVPYVAYGPTMGQVNMDAYTQHKPLDLRIGYDASMKENADAITPATFHLERIAGPVMFLAADDDQIWNSPAQSEMAMQYLHQHNHAFHDVYVHYPNAGHLFLFASPQRPMNQVQFGPITLLMGGTPQGDLAAQRNAWPKVMQFLENALGAGT